MNTHKRIQEALDVAVDIVVSAEIIHIVLTETAKVESEAAERRGDIGAFVGGPAGRLSPSGQVSSACKLGVKRTQGGDRGDGVESGQYGKERQDSDHGLELSARGTVKPRAKLGGEVVRSDLRRWVGGFRWEQAPVP